MDMSDLKWKVQSYGRDCMGNATGYRVYRYAPELEVAICYVGDVYVAGSFHKANCDAGRACDMLNQATSGELEGLIDRLKHEERQLAKV